jgi:uncharacterized protein (TIGR02594 family)
MQEIIDVPSNVAQFAIPLSEGGVKTVIRYYNHHNSIHLPTKCLTVSELQALHDAGLSVCVVFEQNAGAGGDISDFAPGSGTADATRALALAAEMNQPAGSAIYFGVDWDFAARTELDQIAVYFGEVKQTLNGKYIVGVYGSGTVGRRMKQLGLADLIWLAGSTGWSGFTAALNDGIWAIFQKQLETISPIGGFSYDGNIANPSFASFGQFGTAAPVETPRGQGTAALFKVIAGSGLNLRAGPGDSFRVLDTLKTGVIVRGLERDGQWIKVDLDGDGNADGYVFGSFLQAVSGGLPLPDPTPAPAQTPTSGTTPPGLAAAGVRRPIDVARDEMKLDVQEIPGSQNNPRIVMYHATTAGGAAPDEVAWCSSFVNYCVEQTGLRGTDSKVARSWHDQHWGRDVTANPVEGDIVVFSRHSPTQDGGHVAFFLDQDETDIRVLGGNQNNRIGIGSFPKDGMMGSTHFSLLSIRRG